jgi:hypothetical protein
MAQTYIRQGMLFLRQSQARFRNVKRTLDLFEWVLAQKGFLIATSDMPLAKGPQASAGHKPVNNNPHNVNNRFSTTDMAQPEPNIQDTEIPLLDDGVSSAGTCTWFEDLLGFDFLEKLDIIPANRMGRYKDMNITEE